MLVAGASGDLGSKICELLVERGDEVLGLTRSSSKAAALEARGVRPVLGDLLDGHSTRTAVEAAAPEAIVQVPTALPERGPLRPRDFTAHNRLRVAGTRHLIEAAIECEVRRFVSESIVVVYGYRSGDWEFDERAPVATVAPLRAAQPAIDAVHSQERLVFDAARSERIDAIVVRVGFYYGGDVGSTQTMTKLLRRGMMVVSNKPGAIPWVEVTDAARGIVAALDRGRSGETYNVAGDKSAGVADLARALARELGTKPPRELPLWMIKLGARYYAVMSQAHLNVSNRKAKEELGWSPRFPTIEDGVRQAVPRLRALL